MDTKDMRKEVDRVADVLGDLMRTDIAAAESYDVAIDRIDSQATCTHLRTHRGDHERQANDLAEAIRDMGHEPPKSTPDMKGRLREGTTALRSAISEDQALKALVSNAENVADAYADALKERTYPGAVTRILESGLDDTARHKMWLEQQLSVGVGQERRY